MPAVRTTLRRLPVLACLLAGALPLTGPLAGPLVAADREPTPVEVYERFRKHHDPKMRRRAVEALAEARGGDVVRALLDALEDEDDRVRAAAAESLLVGRDLEDERDELERRGLRKGDPFRRVTAVQALGRAGPAAHPALVACLSDRDHEVRRAAVRELTASGVAAHARHLSEALLDTDPRVRALAVHGLGVLQGPAAAGAAAAVLRGDRSPEPRVAACRVLALAPTADTAVHLGYALTDVTWSVRVAAAGACVALAADVEAARAAAPKLVAALGREERRRVRHEFAVALAALSGIDFGPEHERWLAWLADEGTRFVPPPRRRATRKAAEHGSTAAHLLDLPIESDHVVFVVDLSHSMGKPLRFGGERSKRDVLLEAFEQVMSRLPEPSWANLITFGTEPEPYKDRLFRATRSARKALVRELGRRVPDGRTNIYDSLALALGDPDADTVVLVTDGAPSEGRHTTRRAILDAVAEDNRYRLARVHTVEIGSANTSRRWRGFMQELADAAGGHYLAR